MRPEKKDLEIADLSTPLAPGVVLIEASAGTGKTYTVAALFLRLILECGLEVREILVTTFTVPATAELRDRIRQLLRAADDAFATGCSTDTFSSALLTRFTGDEKVVRSRLAQALHSFDEAAIHTIHGFCERMLRDRAFESGGSFDQELVTDEDGLIREIAEDFWRKKFYECHACLSAAAAAKKLSVETLSALLYERLKHPLATIVPAFSSGAMVEVQGALLEKLEQLQKIWNCAAAEIQTCFLENNAWAKKPYSDGDVMRGHLDNTAACLDDLAALPGFHSLFVFANSAIAKGTSARGKSPEHEFFGCCEELGELCGRYSLAIQLEFLQWAPAELDRRKSRRNVLSFSDLLTRLHRGLSSEGGDALAVAIRSRFKAALIDEFQDTDSLQDQIFDRIFGDGQSWLFLIGDPKQAIYSFRSADVFTYLSAADRTPRQFTLGKNFRSATALVEATNQLFSRPHPDRSFLLDRIRFLPVQSSGKNENDLFSGDNIAAPLRICTFASDEKNKDDVSSEIAPTVASEIARMLDGHALLGSRPVVPNDIAVLTATNRQALAMLRALQSLGVPGVVLSNGNVLATLEAGELRTVLAAISNPRDEGRIRAALLTGLTGRTAAQVHAISEDEVAWEAELERFFRWHELWAGKGFIQMFRQFLLDLDVRARMLQRRDGERQLTNLLHLSEILQKAATENRLSPGALLKWLAREISEAGETGREEHEIRLDRDDAAVRIVTIHKSKGLEYNIVFCPFLWTRNGGNRNGPVRFHDPERNGGLILDLGSEEAAAHRALAADEQLAEHARLVYVAMTRARQRCDVIWGQFKTLGGSAAAWLLHAPAIASQTPGTVAAALDAHMKALPAAQWRADLDGLAARSNGTIQIVEMADPAAAPHYVSGETGSAGAARTFDGMIERDWSVSSFSSLAEQYDAESPDHDSGGGGATTQEEKEPEGIHAFPAGARTGICLHEILEELDFTKPAAIDALVTRKLQAFSFDAKQWKAPVRECLDGMLRTRLAPGFTLGEIGFPARLTEMEFYLPAGKLDAASLRVLLASDAERLEFSPRRGWLKGFIDLVFQHGGRFYLADWKSNRLGSHGRAYTQAALNSAMASHHYGLQYHLYTAALHRYLRWRLPGYHYDEHFGGVFYIFLRGVDPTRPDLGIVHRRPDLATIDGLDQWLK